MPSSDDETMTAGRFASRTLLSAKALRIYADRDLLPPRRVDPLTGYRYYTADQVPTGWLIGLLRSAGLSLEQIHSIVRADRRTAAQLVDEAAASMNRLNGARRAVLVRARLHLANPDPEVDMSTVNTALEPDRPVLSVMRRMTPQQMEGVVHEELARLRRVAAAAGLDETGDAFGVFHAPITDDSDGPLEIVLPVDGLTDRSDDVRSYRLPGGQVATRPAEGHETHFPEILALYDEVHAWISGTGRTPVGPPREVWHNSPDGPGDLRLTIAWPYA